MLEQVTDRCCFLPSDPETDRPALGYVRGDHACLQVDAGNSPAHYALMQAQLRARGLPAPDAIALTHSHWDHTYGMCAAPCRTICCTRTQTYLQAMSRWTWTADAMESRLATHEDILFCHEYILKEYPDPTEIRVVTADETFDEYCVIDLGGATVHLIRLPNSHADDCVVVHVPEEGVIFLGDILYKDLHHEPPCWHRARFEALCTSLRQLSFDWAVTGHHGLVSRAELMDDLLTSLSDPEDLVLD